MKGSLLFLLLAAFGSASALADRHALPVLGMSARAITEGNDQITVSGLRIGSSWILAAFDAEPGSQNIQRRARQLCESIGYRYARKYTLVSFQTSDFPALFEVRDGAVSFPKVYATRVELSCGPNCSASSYHYSYAVFESIWCAQTPLRSAP